jgi:hypothetical protein
MPKPDTWDRGWVLVKLLRRREVDTQTGCWIWTGVWHRQGYGRMSFTVGGRPVYKLVHHVAAWLWKGTPLDAGVRVVQECRNPACFNPDHLVVVGGGQAAVLRYVKKKYGIHLPRGEDHYRCRMTLFQAEMVRDALVEGTETKRQIADRVGVTWTQVNNIARGRSWTHIWGKKRTARSVLAAARARDEQAVS